MSSYDSHASFEDAFDLLDEDRPEETVDGIAHKKIPESPQQTKSKIEHHRVNSDVSEVDKDILAQDETMKARIAQGYGPGNEIGG